MANLYIIGIGGTGSRVIRAFTMLAAAGVKIGNYEGVYPIIIDPDEKNGDKERTITLLKKYVEVHSKLKATTDGSLFAAKIKNIKDLLSKSDNSTGIRDFQFSTFYGEGQPFKGHIEYTKMDDNSKDIVSMLFSDYHLDLDLELGFYGNPNIGVSVLNSFETSEDFKLFSKNFGNNDRIFIISSIFGGTGASGFPLLVKTFRNPVQASGANAMAGSLIGACVVMPYFNLAKDGNVSSNYFITKAKAALSYYEKNLDHVNDLYYIGDTSSYSESYSEGGSDQINCAHLVDLIAATSIFNFAVKSEIYLGSPSFNEYYFDDDNIKSEINLYKLGKASRGTIASPLIKLFFLNRLHNQEYYHKIDPWVTEKNLSEDFFITGDGQFLEGFLSQFEEWLKELATNERKFIPFNLDTTDFISMIIGMPSTKSSLGRLSSIFKSRFGKEMFDSKMNAYRSDIKAEGLDYYIKLYDKASSEIIKKNKLI